MGVGTERHTGWVDTEGEKFEPYHAVDADPSDSNGPGLVHYLGENTEADTEREAYTNPMENIAMTCTLVLVVACRLATLGIGRAMISRSKAMLIALAEIIILFDCIHLPWPSRSQFSQPELTGKHWKTTTKRKAMPYATVRANRILMSKRRRLEGKMRR